MAAESDFGIFSSMKKACTEGGWVRYGNFGSPIKGRDQSGNHDTDPYGVEKPVILAQKCVKTGFLGIFWFSMLVSKPYKPYWKISNGQSSAIFNRNFLKLFFRQI